MSTDEYKERMLEFYLTGAGIFIDSPNYNLAVETFNAGYATGEIKGFASSNKEYEKGYENGFDAGARWAKEY